uniref:Uncharacterized protein n=1 Tax=Sphaerodactylus townsendi TaxID=933632 RepID=A0ACB8FI44_9SAUR
MVPCWGCRGKVTKIPGTQYRQLRIVTGEWFFEERAKRFKQSNLLGADVVRKSLIRRSPESSSDLTPGGKPKDQSQASTEDTSKQDTAASFSSGMKSVISGPKKIGTRVLRAVTKGELVNLKAEDGRSIRSDTDIQSIHSTDRWLRTGKLNLQKTENAGQ